MDLVLRRNPGRQKVVLDEGRPAAIEGTGVLRGLNIFKRQLAHAIARTEPSCPVVAEAFRISEGRARVAEIRFGPLQLDIARAPPFGSRRVTYLNVEVDNIITPIENPRGNHFQP